MRTLISAKTFGRPSIGLALFGCANRPFYQICVFPDKALGRHYEGNIIEQVGTFDPIPNSRNEKLVAIDIGRIKYWVGVRNARISVTLLELLGLSGLFPIHPKTFIRARNYREQAEKVEAETAQEESAVSSVAESTENIVNSKQ
uniref:Small ribosomal subunit protein bS16m n=1 Tax=Syphacia muris TaxID=451379 RepID=A0A0N5AWD4_9BILA